MFFTHRSSSRNAIYSRQFFPFKPGLSSDKLEPSRPREKFHPFFPLTGQLMFSSILGASRRRRVSLARPLVKFRRIIPSRPRRDKSFPSLDRRLLLATPSGFFRGGTTKSTRGCLVPPCSCDYRRVQVKHGYRES